MPPRPRPADRPTLHLVGLPHTTTTRDVTVCAFTTKAVKFCRMMKAQGWRIVLYWGDRNDADVDEHVVLHTEAERREWFGDFDANTLPTVAGSWNSDTPEWRTLNSRAAMEILARAEPHDLILLTGGLASEPIARMHPSLLVAEWAAGYTGWFAPRVCFESYAWMHQCYGVAGIHDGRFYDVVIPNFFDPDEWQLGDRDGGYLLYLGRLISRKGVGVAGDIAARAGMPLKVAGSGFAKMDGGAIVCEDGTRVEGDVEYVGTVGVEERAKLIGGAVALLCPTLYVEPFGAVAVEAQMCGVPAIATDFGAFPETIEDGFTGFLIRTIAEGVRAVEQAGSLDSEPIRDRALERFSLDAVGPRYTRWFDRLGTLWGGGFYA